MSLAGLPRAARNGKAHGLAFLKTGTHATTPFVPSPHGHAAMALTVAPQIPTPMRKAGARAALRALLLASVALLVPSWLLASPVGPVSHIVITEAGVGPAGEDCARFRLTPKQVRAFMQRAVLISGRQNHDHFLYGPCVVRGTLRTRFDHWAWEIRNLGTGSLASSNGDVFLLGDPRQASDLGDAP